MKDLKQTIKLMKSDNYKDRFIAEYWQLKIRYEKLKNFCNKIEVSNVVKEEIKHDCPYEMLREQQRIMGQYLHVLETRALVEKIDLDIK